MTICLNEPATNGPSLKGQPLHIMPKIIGSMPIARRKSANSLLSILSVCFFWPSTNSSLSFTDQLLQQFFSPVTDYWPQSTCHVASDHGKLELQIWWLSCLDLQPGGHLRFSRLNPLICSCKFLSGWPRGNSTSMYPFSPHVGRMARYP